jgi:REP element-mobilizing transposase RayT
MPGMKYHPHGSVLFVTFAVEEGLLFLCNPLIEALIHSCLARASTLYPVGACHVAFEATHLHMLIVVDNPANVSEFMRHFKAESAHMINGILGRTKTYRLVFRL